MRRRCVANNTVTFRFNGRFVYALSPKKVWAIAPHFTPPFDVHQPKMAIRHDLIQFQLANTTITTLEPECRLTSDIRLPAVHAHGDPEPEVLVWDLAGLTMSIGAPAASTLEPTPDKPKSPLHLPELEEVRGGGRPALKTSALRAGSRSESNAVFELVGATGKSRPLVDRKTRVSDFVDVSVNGDQATPKQKNGADFSKFPADFVEFEVQATSPLSMTFHDEHGRQAGVVVVKPGALVCISHLCARIKVPLSTDLEFSQYYNLLTTDPGTSSLVPFVLRGEGLAEGMGCHLVATIDV
jgi:hypothetical protein